MKGRKEPLAFFFKFYPCSLPFSDSGLLAVSEGLKLVLPDIHVSPSLLPSHLN